MVLEVDVKLGDKVDVDVRKLFEAEKRSSNDLQVVALPASGAVDPDAHFHKLHDVISTLIRVVEDTKSNTNELKSEIKKLHAKTEKMECTKLADHESRVVLPEPSVFAGFTIPQQNWTERVKRRATANSATRHD